MTMSRHERFEELISASLSGDLSDAERAQLDAHLDGCAACRETLASFAEQRRIMSGLRHIAPPRDLGARVRTGVERGAFATTPWWRRPALMFAGLGGGLAAVAGALLAIVLLNGAPDDANIGVGSDSPLPSFTEAAPSATPASPPPSATPVASEPVASPSPSAAPPEPEMDPRPDVFLAYTGPFDNLLLTLRDGRTGDTLRELGGPVSGPPIAAEMSPNGQFLAYITQVGQSGMNEVWLLHLGWNLPAPGADAERSETALPEWESISLGQSVAGSEFLERLAWSPDSQYLAFTLAEPGVGPDVWITDVTDAESWQYTTSGDAYAGSWHSDDALWVSFTDSAGGEPVTMDASISPDARYGPLSGDVGPMVGVFQPLLSPDRSQVIYWRGVMERSNDEWVFLEGGAPYIARAAGDTSIVGGDERLLFSDVTIDRDAFVSAGIAWGADSDAYAVWDAEWTGLPQGENGEYPNIRRVYFGHASDDRELTEDHAIDAADLPEGASVVDVKVPTTRHLLVTAQLPIGGTLSVPRAQLILVTRNTGRVADEVAYFEGPGDDAWFGPAAFDAWFETIAP